MIHKEASTLVVTWGPSVGGGRGFDPRLRICVLPLQFSWICQLMGRGHQVVGSGHQAVGGRARQLVGPSCQLVVGPGRQAVGGTARQLVGPSCQLVVGLAMGPAHYVVRWSDRVVRWWDRPVSWLVGWPVSSWDPRGGTGLSAHGAWLSVDGTRLLGSLDLHVGSGYQVGLLDPFTEIC
jgi:hypothetical protein